jgi:hypothetical protein
MHGNVINVLTNVDQIQSILPHFPHDGTTIGDVSNTNHLIYLQNLIETSLYKYLNVSIHH